MSSFCGLASLAKLIKIALEKWYNFAGRASYILVFIHNFFSSFTQRNLFWILLNQTKFRLQYPFPIDLATNGIPFRAISIGKWCYNPYLVCFNRSRKYLSLRSCMNAFNILLSFESASVKISKYKIKYFVTEQMLILFYSFNFGWIFLVVITKSFSSYRRNREKN